MDHGEEPADIQSASARLAVGSAHRQGLRPSMQDRSVAYGCLAGRPDTDFFAVFDGHGEPPPRESNRVCCQASMQRGHAVLQT